MQRRNETSTEEKAQNKERGTSTKRNCKKEHHNENEAVRKK